MDLSERTAAEKSSLHAAEVRAAEASLPVMMRHPLTNKAGLVSAHHVQSRLDAGWVRA